MGIILVNGIVARYTDYRESDRILTLYTQEQGRLEISAHGCRKAQSPLLCAAQPFAYGEFTLFYNHDKYTLNSADIRETFYPLRNDYERFAAGSYILWLTCSGAQTGLANEQMFSMLYHALSFLAYTECPAEDLTLGFLLRYLDRNGYCPSLTRCANCNKDLRKLQGIRFDEHAGGAICPDCGLGRPVSNLTLEAMRRILMLPDAELQKIRLPHKVSLELKDILPRYAEMVLERPILPLKANMIKL